MDTQNGYIEQRLEQLENVVEGAFQEFVNLRNVLDPILAPEEAKDTAGEGAPLANSKLANTIDESIRRLENLTINIIDVKHRSQV